MACQFEMSFRKPEITEMQSRFQCRFQCRAPKGVEKLGSGTPNFDNISKKIQRNIRRIILRKYFLFDRHSRDWYISRKTPLEEVVDKTWLTFNTGNIYCS